MNLFVDMEDGQRLSQHSQDHKDDQAWLAVEQKYAPVADKLAEIIMKSDRLLTSKEARVLDRVCYDGSDAYDSPEESVDFLPELYDRQIEVLRKILKL